MHYRFTCRCLMIEYCSIHNDVSYSLTYLTLITSGEPGPDKRLRLRRYDGSVQRLLRVATRQLLELCILHFDSPRCYDRQFLQVRLCSYSSLLLACLARLAPHFTHSPKSRQAGRRIHRPTATVAKQPLCPSSSLLAVRGISTNMRAGF